MTTTKKKTTAKKSTTKKQPAKGTTKKVAAKKAAAASAPATTPATTTAPAKTTAKGTIVTLISREGGATLGEIMEAIGWQAHSVRGTIATLGKTMTITSAKNEEGARTYCAA